MRLRASGFSAPVPRWRASQLPSWAEGNSHLMSLLCVASLVSLSLQWPWVIIQERHLARARSRPSAGADSNLGPPDFRALALSSLSIWWPPMAPSLAPPTDPLAAPPPLGGSREHGHLRTPSQDFTCLVSHFSRWQPQTTNEETKSDISCPRSHTEKGQL